MRVNYDIPELRAFLQASARGSFHKAAYALGLSPSALSRRIGRLEEQVGTRLIDRMTRSVVLTAAGRNLAAAVGPLVLALDESLDEIAMHARGAGGRLVIGCVTTVACSVLPHILQAFRQTYPDVGLQLHDDTGKRVLEDVLAGRVEFAVNTLLQAHPEVYEEALANDPYVAALPETHELAARRTLTWASLQSHRLIGLRRTSANRQQIDDAMAAVGLAMPWFDEVEHLSSMLGFLREGQMIGIVPRLALPKSGMPGIRVCQLTSPAVARRIGLIRRADASLSRPAEKLWKLLRTALGQPKARSGQGKSMNGKHKQSTQRGEDKD